MTAVIIAALTLVAGVIVAWLQRDPTPKREVGVMLSELELLRSMRESEAPAGAIEALERAHLDRAERYAGPLEVTPERRIAAARQQALLAAASAVGSVILLFLGLTNRLPVAPGFALGITVGAAVVYAISGVAAAMILTSLRRARAAAIAQLSKKPADD